MIDIVIITKGKLPYLFNCLESIKSKTFKTDYHIYIGDTGSTSGEIGEMILFIKENFPNKNVSLIKYDYYNFAANNNSIVVNYCKNKYILFCNNDIKLVDNCIDEMVEYIDTHENIGTVGCKLMFEDKSIQHAGQCLFLNEDGGNLWVSHRGLRESNLLYNDIEPVAGNTGGFMLTSRDNFLKYKFNEEYIECLEDLEYNLSLIADGMENIYMGNVAAYHYENVTRGRNEQGDERFRIDYANTFLPFIKNNQNKNKILNYALVI